MTFKENKRKRKLKENIMSISKEESKMEQTLEGNCMLVSKEGEKFKVLKKVAALSILIKEMIDEDEDEEDVSEIPLLNVKSSILLLVIKFCKHHHNNPMPEISKPLNSAKMIEIVPEWYAKFVENVEQDILFEMILAANYMDIKSLLNLTCAKVASMIKGKTPEEIRGTFNIENDFTPEEEALIREENKWVEDL